MRSFYQKPDGLDRRRFLRQYFYVSTFANLQCVFYFFLQRIATYPNIPGKEKTRLIKNHNQVNGRLV